MAYISALLSAIPGIRHAFLTAGETATFDKTRLTAIKQVHGTDILNLTQREQGRPHVDGVLTQLQGQAVGVATADCLPLLMASRTGSIIASVHAGWKGAAHGILQRSVRMFAEQGVVEKNIIVAIGPHICPCCYEVSAEFYSGLLTTSGGKIAQNYKEAFLFETPIAATSSSAKPGGSTSQWFDLASFCLFQLMDAGIAREQIDIMNICTYCSPHMVLGSYRRRTHFPAPKTQQISWIEKHALRQ